MTPSPFFQGDIWLLTQHEKENLLRPLFFEAFEAHVQRVQGYDTDTLGTFTREIPRFGTQIGAARKKAQLALELSGGRFGLGSEGAFLPGPLGLGSTNLEVLVFLDSQSNLEVVESASAPGLHLHTSTSSFEELIEWTHLAEFPAHALVVRPDDLSLPVVRKGIKDVTELQEAFQQALRLASTGKVFVEHDLRAHLHPQRQTCILEAGRKLISRLQSLCPECGTPGFGIHERVRGRPCEECGTPTLEPVAELWKCPLCPTTRLRPLEPEKRASPAVCPLCNP